MRDKSRSRAVRFFCYVTTAHFEINRVLLSFRAAAKLPGRMNPATFRLNALMARRFVSAAEHHTLQQAGPVERKKKTAGRWRWGGSVSTTCCNRQNSARTAQDILLLRVKEQKCFKTAYPPSLPAWGVHTALWEGFELTQVTVAPSPVWRRKRRGRRRGGWIIQPASAARLWRLVFYGEVRRAGNNNKQHLLTWQPGDTASKEPRFSRGQGIISESSSRIIAPSQNDTRRCGTPSQIAGLSLPTHRMKWQPCPADSKASEPE